MYIHAIYAVHPGLQDNPDPKNEHFYKKMEIHNFSDLFEKNEMRRLSVLIKNGLGAGMRVIETTGIDQLNAIITGTGKGSISKIEQFLGDIDIYNETALNPSVFIQSTHNTINGQLALKTQANTYNMTHVNQGFTLHNVLRDAQLFLKEYGDKTVLAGVFEENTVFNVSIHEKAGLSGIAEDGHYPIIWGEGVTFFSLGNQFTSSKVRLSGTQCFTNLYGSDHWQEALEYFRKSSKEDGTAYLLGYNNDFEKDTLYKPLIEIIENNNQPYYNFKQHSGEHDTAGGYAIYMANRILKRDPGEMKIFGDIAVSKVIIFNHFKDYICHIIEMEN